ncbi:MAG: YggS family pyridoxal phosphate-dependent enzyme [Betaproteobacteria bacterium]|nr:YggS family pyridoxal phosphate-dependent enzyme [Betaproteobacteria bacterium]
MPWPPRMPTPEGPLLRPLESRIAPANYQYDTATSDARSHSAGVASPEGPLLRPLEWHFIGPIQSNKTRLIAQYFDWVHSIERLKIAERLSAARAAGLAPLQVCIQVKIGDERSKSGVPAGEALALARAVAELPRLKLRGLMAIPPASADHARQRRHFAQLRQLKDAIARSGIALDTLSMGMSDDLEAAIAEGATLVRVGTAIFGPRRKV